MRSTALQLYICHKFFYVRSSVGVLIVAKEVNRKKFVLLVQSSANFCRDAKSV